MALDLDIVFSLKFKTVFIEIVKNHEIKKSGEGIFVDVVVIEW